MENNDKPHAVGKARKTLGDELKLSEADEKFLAPIFKLKEDARVLWINFQSRCEGERVRVRIKQGSKDRYWCGGILSVAYDLLDKYIGPAHTHTGFPYRAYQFTHWEGFSPVFGLYGSLRYEVEFLD